jgi:hypothetical protein
LREARERDARPTDPHESCTECAALARLRGAATHPTDAVQRAAADMEHDHHAAARGDGHAVAFAALAQVPATARWLAPVVTGVVPRSAGDMQRQAEALHVTVPSWWALRSDHGTSSNAPGPFAEWRQRSRAADVARRWQLPVWLDRYQLPVLTRVLRQRTRDGELERRALAEEDAAIVLGQVGKAQAAADR